MRRMALALILGVFCVQNAGVARAQSPLGAGFTYQGELADSGASANGVFDLRFRLYDAEVGGNQVGSVLCSDNLVVVNGRFSVSLDFGAALFAGQRRFLEIDVRPDAGLGCADGTGYTALTPRQELTATPNATFAQTAASAVTASNAASLNGQSGSFYQSAGNLTGTLPSARLSGTYSGQLTLSNPANIFTGDGAAITNISATNISTGVLDAARMPTNWAAGGDLSGLFPNPTINAGAVSLGKLSPSVQGVLSKLSSLAPAPAPAEPVAWGDNSAGQLNIPGLPLGVTYAAVSVGGVHSLALGSDGTVVAWGNNFFGQLNVPGLPAGVTYTAVAGCGIHSLALRSDGTVAAWGRSTEGQLNVPALPPGVTYTAVAGGNLHSLALRSDGMVLAWGDNSDGQLDVPALDPGVTYTAVAAGESHSLALRSNGTVVVWGANYSGQLNVPPLPPGVTYVSIAGGNYHSLAIRSDGTVAAWGENSSGQLNVPVLPPGVTYTALAAGQYHSLALRSDGTVAAWGESAFGALNVPALPPGVTYAGIAAGGSASIALRQVPLVSALGTTVGLSIGGAAPPPANGISVAGASSFAARVTAASFAGSGSQLTNLSATNITTGTLSTAQIPNLDASKITTGTLSTAQVPNLDAAKITTGTLGTALIPNLDASKITTGTLNAALVPNLDASKITSGTLAEARLSSNIALRNAANVFTSTGLTSFAGNLSVAGNIGIGTAPNASYALQAVSGGDTQIALTGGGGKHALSGNIPPRTWAIQSSGVNVFPGSTPSSLDTAFQIIDRNVGLTRVLIDTDGNVGIGTTSPSQRLAVAGNVAADNFVGSGAGLTSLNASNVTTGTLSTARVPNLDASKITSGTLADSLLSSNVPLKNGANAFTSTGVNSFAGTVGIGTSTPTQTLDVNGRINVANGVIQRGLPAITATSDLGLYSQVSGSFMRFVTNGGEFHWSTDGGIGTNDRMVLLPNGNLSVGGNLRVATAGDATITLTRNGSAPNLEVGAAAGPGSFSTSAATDDVVIRNMVLTKSIHIQNGAGSSALTVNGSNNVGIGTNSPTNKLTVAGNMNVTGSLSKGGGSFMIDHPLDPENKYLYHSFVESPDMMNIYNGNVTTGPDGYATITLPDYFEALNRDFRYQLTVIDENDDMEVFLWAKVVREVKDNQFTLRSSRGSLKVSWQVTGVRKDAWAEKNRIPNSVVKVGPEKGRYLHPEAFGKSALEGVHAVPVGSSQRTGQ